MFLKYKISFYFEMDFIFDFFILLMVYLIIKHSLFIVISFSLNGCYLLYYSTSILGDYNKQSKPVYYFYFVDILNS